MLDDPGHPANDALRFLGDLVRFANDPFRIGNDLGRFRCGAGRNDGGREVIGSYVPGFAVGSGVWDGLALWLPIKLAPLLGLRATSSNPAAGALL